MSGENRNTDMATARTGDRALMQGDVSETRTLAAQIKVYYTLHLPSDIEAGARSPAPLLIALHGYGGNMRQMMREARQCAPPNFAIASVQGVHEHLKEAKEPNGALRYGFGWLTNFHPEESIKLHHQMLRDLIETLISEHIALRESIFLLGFSQSCALNYRFAFTYPHILRGAIGICGGIPGDWQTSALYHQTNARVLHLSGARDEFYPPARGESYAPQLRLRARDVEMRSYDAAHEITPAMREDICAWLQAHAHL